MDISNSVISIINTKYCIALLQRTKIFFVRACNTIQLILQLNNSQEFIFPSYEHCNLLDKFPFYLNNLAVFVCTYSLLGLGANSQSPKELIFSWVSPVFLHQIINPIIKPRRRRRSNRSSRSRSKSNLGTLAIDTGITGVTCRRLN